MECEWLMNGIRAERRDPHVVEIGVKKAEKRHHEKHRRALKNRPEPGKLSTLFSRNASTNGEGQKGDIKSTKKERWR